METLGSSYSTLHLDSTVMGCAVVHHQLLAASAALPGRLVGKFSRETSEISRLQTRQRGQGVSHNESMQTSAEP